jgi:hypothetical protein
LNTSKIEWKWKDEFLNFLVLFSVVRLFRSNELAESSLSSGKKGVTFEHGSDNLNEAIIVAESIHEKSLYVAISFVYIMKLSFKESTSMSEFQLFDVVCEVRGIILLSNMSVVSCKE